MSETPLVSVCVPTYNYGRFIRQCIESVLAQTYSNWELIICDDCSTDDTAEIVRAYAEDPRIRYVKSEVRLGMNANIKRAAEYGRGKYLKVLCSDDWLAPNCLEVLSALMERHPRVALATSAEVSANEAGKPLRIQFLFGKTLSVLSGEEMLNRMARGNGFGGNSSFLIRTSAYRDIGGYDDHCHYAADYDLAARLCRVGNYLHTDEPLFYGRIQSQSSSATDPGRLVDVMDWFDVPKRIFQPRAVANLEWRRYQLLTGNLTARYLVNIALQFLRGESAYARELTKVLLQRGNFWLGVPFLVAHIPLRCFRWITSRNERPSLPPEVGMSPQPQSR
jgi:glycosyltransferase involved in cell wall biosynthesis